MLAERQRGNILVCCPAWCSIAFVERGVDSPTEHRVVRPTIRNLLD
jgi:hypothetical protein